MTAIRIIDDHIELANIGSNTHAQIDTHITANPDGTAQGQMAFWNATLSRWVNTETSELFWDDVNKRFGIGDTTPDKKLTVSHGHLRFNRVVRPVHTVSLATSSSGVLTGAYRYRFTYITAEGETNASYYSSSITASSEKIELTNIPVSTDNKVTGRKIYRTESDESWPYLCKLVTTLNDNTTTAYQDNIADGSLGAYAPGNNTTGGQIYENGDLAMEMNENVTIFGYQAGADNNGYFNAFVGSYAGYSNTTGSDNTANGSYSLYANTTGRDNTANGSYSLYSNTTSNYNTANGSYSLYANTTGNYNTANGFYSLRSNTTGNYNTANGAHSLYSNTTGRNNTANGFYSLRSNTTGCYNTVNGYYSLRSNTTGDNNTALGYQSGRYQADGSTALESPENSVYIGYNSKGYDDNDNNSIVIGYNAVGIGANTVVLGNDSIITTALKGDVGVGTTFPNRILGIGGLEARNIGMERGTVANTAGFDLTLNAGGATSAATDKDGGDLILDSGVSTGSGESGVQIRGCVAGASGTVDRAFEVGMRVLGNKIGFHAVTPIAQQVLATGGGATVDNVITALQNLGLVSQT